jgi:hypothetical protein
MQTGMRVEWQALMNFLVPYLGTMELVKFRYVWDVQLGKCWVSIYQVDIHGRFIKFQDKNHISHALRSH